MEERDQREDSELIEAFLGGEEGAFEELVRRYESQIYNLSYRLLGNPNDAYDACQEVFILLFRKLGTFRSEARFSTWLYRVTTNACRDYRRRKKYTLSLAGRAEEGQPEWEEVIPSDEVSPDDLLISLEQRERVQQGIRRLPERFREIVVLHDIEGYNYAEVSEILGISLGTVKSRLNRARRRLAAELKALRDPGEEKTAEGTQGRGVSSNPMDRGENPRDGAPREAAAERKPEKREEA